MNELVNELGFAVIIVSALIVFSLGWREAVIVATAVPLTFALTLLVNYLAGYSINRVTLSRSSWHWASSWTTRSWTWKTSSATLG